MLHYIVLHYNALYRIILYYIILYYIIVYYILLSPGGLCGLRHCPARPLPRDPHVQERGPLKTGAGYVAFTERGRRMLMFWRELKGSQGPGVVSNHWLDRVLLLILCMFKPPC